MSNPTSTSKQPMDWSMFQQYLSEYVNLELRGEAAELIYPEIAYFIETLTQCEAAYYEEFQRQGEQVSLAVLRSLNEQSGLHEFPFVLQQGKTNDSSVPDPQRNWYEIAVDHGKAWLDVETKQWQQLLLTLASEFTQPDNRQALVGLMSSQPDSESAARELLRVGGDDADIEVIVMVEPDPSAADEFYALEVAVTRPNYFGDFSGIAVSLLSAQEKQQAVTDSLGKVRFSKVHNSLLLAQVAPLRLLITLPDT